MESRPHVLAHAGHGFWRSEEVQPALTTGMDSGCMAAEMRGASRGAATDPLLPGGRILYQTSTDPLLILYIAGSRPDRKAAPRNPLTRPPGAAQRHSPQLDVVPGKPANRPQRPESST